MTLINIPMFVVMLSTLVITGLVLFAYFGDCDPTVAGKVSRPDQVKYTNTYNEM